MVPHRWHSSFRCAAVILHFSGTDLGAGCFVWLYADVNHQLYSLCRFYANRCVECAMKKFFLALLLLISPAAAQEVTVTPTPGMPLRFGGPVQVTVNPGLISLGTKKVTVAVAGVRVGDFVDVVPSSASSPLLVGVILNGTGEVLTAGQVTLTFMTPVALGVSLGNMDVRIRWMGY